MLLTLNKAALAFSPRSGQTGICYLTYGICLTEADSTFSNRVLRISPSNISYYQENIINFSLPNEITPLPTKTHSLPTFSILAQTPPIFAQTPPIFAQPSTFTRAPAGGSRAVEMHWFRWKEIDVLFTIAVTLLPRRTQPMADN